MSGLRSASAWKTRASMYMPVPAMIQAMTAPSGPVALREGPRQREDARADHAAHHHRGQLHPRHLLFVCAHVFLPVSFTAIFGFNGFLSRFHDIHAETPAGSPQGLLNGRSSDAAPGNRTPAWNSGKLAVQE